MKKLLSVVAVLMVVPGPLSAQNPAPGTPTATPVSSPNSTIIQKIIVKVNGEIFTQGELEFRLIQTLRQQNKSVTKAEQLNSDPALQSALAEITPGILLDAVDELLFVQHGREVGVKANDAAFADFIDKIKADNPTIKTEADLQAAMKSEGITMADLRVNFERQYIINGVTRRELMRNMTLTEEEARQYYVAHPDEFMKPATVTLREILIQVPTEMVAGQATINVAADDAAKAKAAALRERAVKGEDFQKLVAEASEAGSKANGGIIGPVLTSDLNPAITEILDKMKVGDVSEPLRVKAGYQLLKLDVRSPAEVETFELSKNLIQDKVLGGRLDGEKNKFVEKLLTQAVIEWKDDNYKKMYESARAAMRARGKTGAGAPGK